MSLEYRTEIEKFSSILILYYLKKVRLDKKQVYKRMKKLLLDDVCYNLKAPSQNIILENDDTSLLNSDEENDEKDSDDTFDY